LPRQRGNPETSIVHIYREEKRAAKEIKEMAQKYAKLPRHIRIYPRSLNSADICIRKNIFPYLGAILFAREFVVATSRALKLHKY
jgi:hypothetical protein